MKFWFDRKNNVKRDKIEIASQLTCDVLDPKLAVIKREILKSHSRIKVGMILHFYTCVEEGIQDQ